MRTVYELEALLAEKEAELQEIRSSTAVFFKETSEEGDAEQLKNGFTPSLTETEKLSLKKDSTQPNIALIAGDNISSMTNLTSNLTGKFDIIYADPPYNTGKSSFVYNDRRRDKWLSFMKSRLILAEKLLKPGGVIFLSINDTEQARLKLLMDDIFGERNFVANMVWRNSSKSGAKRVNLDHEYVLSYMKPGGESQPKWSTSKHQKQIDEMYRIVDKNVGNLAAARKKLNEYVSKLIKTDTEYKWLKNYSHVRENNGKAEIFYTVDLSVPGQPNSRTLKDGTILHPLPDRGWQSADRIDTLLEEGLISWKGDRPYQVKPLEREHRTGVSSVLPKIYTRNGKEELKKMFGSKAPFDFPKPLKLIKTLLSYTGDRNALVLDFFAGSGTTGHAVAELNKEDGGTRNCVLLTNNTENENEGPPREHLIAETVTAVRLRKALTGEGWADGESREPLPGEMSYYTVSMLAPGSVEPVRSLSIDLEPVVIEPDKDQ